MFLDLKNKKIALLLMLATIAVEIYLTPNIEIISIFATFYLILIYKFYGNSLIEFFFYCSLFFSIVTLNNRNQFFVSIIMYILIYIYTQIQKSNKCFSKIKLNKYSIFLIVFTIYITISVIWTEDKGAAFKYLIQYYVSILLFMSYISWNDNDKKYIKSLKFLKNLFYGIVILGTLEICGVKLGLRNVFITKEMYQAHLKRVPTVFFYNPNNYAFFLVLGITALVINNIYKKKKITVFDNIIFIAAHVNIIFTMSRLGLLAIFLSYFTLLAFLFVFRNKQKNNLKVKKIIKYFLYSTMILVVVSLVPDIGTYSARFKNTTVIKNIDRLITKPVDGDDMKLQPVVVVGAPGSDNQRITLLYDVVEGIIFKKNVMGFGVGNTKNYILYKDNTHGVYQIHNFWFEILGDFGIGIFVYLGVIYFFSIFDLAKFYIEESTINNGHLLIPINIAIMLTVLVLGPSSVVTFSTFWITLGLIYSKIFIKKRNLKVIDNESIK